MSDSDSDKKSEKKGPHDEKKESDMTKKNTTYGRGATMPVMAADKFADVVLPDLLEFDPSQIKLDGTLVAVGKRRTGKSWVFRNIMYILRDKFPAGIVISMTDELNKFWRQYIPSKYIYSEYEPEILENVFARQHKIMNDPNTTDEEKEKIAPFFVLLDDVISDARIKWEGSGQPLLKLFVMGRHYKICTFITTQYAKSITPAIRGNTDYVFIMKTIQQRQREALFEDFGDFLTKDAFNQIVDAYTEDNEVLVVDTSPENKVDPLEMMYWWKACDPGPFKVGSKEYWESAMHNFTVPPPTGPESTGDLLTVEDIMPKHFRQMYD